MEKGLSSSKYIMNIFNYYIQSLLKSCVALLFPCPENNPPFIFYCMEKASWMKRRKTWVNDGIFIFAWTLPLMISCIILWTVGWNLWIDTAMLTHIHTETSVFILLACGWWHSGWFSHFIGHRGRTGLCLFRASQRDTVSLSTQLPHWSLYQCQTHTERERENV